MGHLKAIIINFLRGDLKPSVDVDNMSKPILDEDANRSSTSMTDGSVQAEITHLSIGGGVLHVVGVLLEILVTALQAGSVVCLRAGSKTRYTRSHFRSDAMKIDQPGSNQVADSYRVPRVHTVVFLAGAGRSAGLFAKDFKVEIIAKRGVLGCVLLRRSKKNPIGSWKWTQRTPRGMRKSSKKSPVGGSTLMVLGP